MALRFECMVSARRVWLCILMDGYICLRLLASALFFFTDGYMPPDGLLCICSVLRFIAWALHLTIYACVICYDMALEWPAFIDMAFYLDGLGIFIMARALSFLMISAFVS